ncbi:MAG: 3-deoxy-8-phosphooctulonate synthase [Candidatus Omnitrophica bacterium]|nr:3-deoxy-8-phosphooctulonate synthase [Candidatus Omnitrophota bacterium]
MSYKTVRVNGISIGNNHPFVLIAGPCVIESKNSCLEHAKLLKEITAELDVPLIFKSSFDKANRLSINSFRGPGLKKGLRILGLVKERFDVPILSDVHCVSQIRYVKEVLDIIQVPALLSRQTDLLVEVALTKKVINVKKGQFLAPWDVKNIIKKIESTGNKNILITERGSCFGYNNLVSDLRALPIMKDLGYPIIYDATHSVQVPAGLGTSSGGERQFVAGLSRAAISMGCDGIFLEVHINPDKALCDGPNMIDLSQLKKLLIQLKKIDSIIKGY